MKLHEVFSSDRGLFLDGKECPTAEKLWASAHGELDRGGNEQVILHTAQCPACAEGWRLARKHVSVNVPLRRQAWWGRSSLQFAAAAVVVIAIGLGIGYRMVIQQEPASSVYREVERGWLESTVPDGVALSRSDCRLQWTPGPEGTTYDVRITTDTLEPLAEVWRIDRSELLLEQETLEDLPAGSALFWRVTAHPPDGRQVSSPTFRTRIQ